jgi:hypothetical protein
LSNFSALASQPDNPGKPRSPGGLKASFADRLTHRPAAERGMQVKAWLAKGSCGILVVGAGD